MTTIAAREYAAAMDGSWQRQAAANEGSRLMTARSRKALTRT
jgi:hypothetical protein